MGIVSSAASVLRNEGLGEFARRTKSFISKRIKTSDNSSEKDESYVDVLFINGCHPSVPHPVRYRVAHQCEQLNACGISTSVVYHEDLTLDDVRRGRTIIVFRCPYTEIVGEVIARAKALNKRVLFDVDDLVIDTCYTDQIAFLDTFTPEQRQGYDEGVHKMKQTLLLCDGAITSTDRLAQELEKYVPYAFVNRNVASEEMLTLSEDAYKARTSHSPEKIIIGYFSGSITHDDDFTMLLPVLKRVFTDYPQVYLQLVGEISIPDELEEFKERILFTPFIDWKDLPALIASVDINIAPLTNLIFNEAKSENKWTEAALVRVPTVASRIGAFDYAIQDGVTGLLCSDDEEWYKCLSSLIADADLRNKIGQAAYEFASARYVTLYTGASLVQFIRKVSTENVVVNLPGLVLSGGILVALRHCAILQDAGIDVTIYNRNFRRDGNGAWLDFDGRSFPLFHHPGTTDCAADSLLKAHVDKGVATMWNTLKLWREYPAVREIYYLVQGLETEFYEAPDPERMLASATYSCDAQEVTYVAISQWCASWLSERFQQNPTTIHNGIDLEAFYPVQRDFSGKIRILVEGDCDSHFKNVDESFAIIDQLDPDRYEVWYMSNHGKVKPEYRVDKNLGSVPFAQVADVYRSCHILLKTSLFEGFSYPPLEMMATGGYVVLFQNGGNSEYVEDEKNCLLYTQGNINEAVEKVERIVSDKLCQEALFEGGQETGKRYSWTVVKKEVMQAYQVQPETE